MDVSRWSSAVEGLFRHARSFARNRRNSILEPIHMMGLLVLSKVTCPPSNEIQARVQAACQMVQKIFNTADGNLDAFAAEVESVLQQLPKLQEVLDVHSSNRLKQVLLRADEHRESQGDRLLHVDALLRALCSHKELAEALRKAKFTSYRVEECLISARSELLRLDTTPQEQQEDAEGSYLERFGTDLTELAESGRLDPVIGRDKEIHDMIRILSRRTKNNPCLIGEPGVGKTTVVEGLAQMIVERKVPSSLDCRVVTLDLGALVSGTKHRGDFEERLQATLQEVKRHDGRIIIFIDEVHLLVGAGKLDGPMDAANLLKPMLARGELRCVGATTIAEYREYIEKDAALARRFQEVTVREPSVEATVEILKGLRPKYEAFHGVRVEDGALRAAAALGDRYISSRFLPDKAVDLLDEACAQCRVMRESIPDVLVMAENSVLQLEMEAKARRRPPDQFIKEGHDSVYERTKERYTKEKELIDEIQRLTLKREQLREKIKRAENAADSTLVLDLKCEALPGVEARLEQLQENREMQRREAEIRGQSLMIRDVVGPAEVAEVVSRWSQIPVHKLSQTEKQRLLHLEEVLNQQVVGQSRAVAAVTRAILRNGAGLSRRDIPIGSFLFVGPTGVGKTELCRALARELFDSAERLQRFDMSEFTESHSIARLIGSPPGYVGFNDGGQLTEVIRRNPYSVVLFDEVEKAHPSVWNIFLQVLDAGRLTDARGVTVDFSNCLICFTSNLGAESILFEADQSNVSVNVREKVTTEIQKHFRPEFRNRLDDIILFSPLRKQHLHQVVSLQLAEVQRRCWDAHGIQLSVTDAAIAAVVHEAFEPSYGARPLRRYLERHVVSELATHVLRGDLKNAMEVQLDFQQENEKPAALGVDRKLWKWYVKRPNRSPVVSESRMDETPSE